MSCLTRDDWRRVGLWAAFSLAFNFAWELAQLPLYMIAETGSAFEIAYAVVHCTIGDLFIATGAYILAMLALGESKWPGVHPWRGAAITIAFGFAYTAYSEWYNVYRAGNWAYASAMPLVFGLGLSPLLQWLVVPAVTVAIVNRFLRADSGR